MQAVARASSVSKTDDGARVRDGYVSPSVRGHARALATPAERPICRTNVLANDRACTPLPPQNFHGKEGLDGSSPSEGFKKSPAKGLVVLPAVARSRFFAGTR